jgi:hypothetical protein
MKLRFGFLALGLAGLTSTAFAQKSSVLLRVGDQVPGAGAITDIESIEVTSNGSWMALVRTDDPVARTVLFIYGAPHLMAGASPPSLGGATLAELGPPTWDLFQFPIYVARLSGGPSAQAVMFDQQVQLLAGQSATVFLSQLPAGSTWRRFDDVHFGWNEGYYLLRGAIDDAVGGTADRSFAAAVWMSYPGIIGQIVVLALEGELAPGLARAIDTVRAGAGQARMGRSGARAVWSCDLEGSTSDDGCVYFTQFWPQMVSTLIAREGSPSPVAGRAWGALEDHALDLDSQGSWTLRGKLDASDPSSDEVLVHEATVVAREGDVLPDTAPHALTTLGLGRGLLDEAGRVAWFGAWDDPGTPGADEALFVDHAAVLKTGATEIAGSLLAGLDHGPRSYSVDASYGRFVACIGTLADGTRGAFLLDRAEVNLYCTAKPNSLGVEPVLGWNGDLPSASLGSGFTVHATKLVAKVPTIYFYGTDGPLAQPFHGGTLCVAPPLKRGLAQSSSGTSGASGFANMDFNAWIASGVDPRLDLGQRVFVQLWTRDPGFPPPDDVGLTAALEFRIGP